MSCTCCGDDCFTTTSVGNMLRVLKCGACGFLIGKFVAVDRPGSGYDSLNIAAYEASIGKMRIDESSFILEQVERFKPSPRAWLDIGCGAGGLLGRVIGKYEAFGVEPDPIAREMARMKSSGAQLVAGIAELTAANRALGVVSMLDVLEHFEASAIIDVLLRVRELLSETGVFVVKVPSTDGVFFRVVHAVARILPSAVRGPIERLWQLKYPSPHYVYFNEDSLHRILRRCGLEPEMTWYLPALPIASIKSRLTMDPTIPKWTAVAMIPVAFVLSLIEKIGRRTDSLVVIARPVAERT